MMMMMNLEIKFPITVKTKKQTLDEAPLPRSYELRPLLKMTIKADL